MAQSTIDTVRDWNPDSGPVIERIKAEPEIEHNVNPKDFLYLLHDDGKGPRKCLLPDDVKILDTRCIARLIKKALTMHALDMNEFSVVVVGKPTAQVKMLLTNPLPYPKLSKPMQDDYWTMAKWLHKSIPERLEPFNLILRARGLPEKPVNVDLSSDESIRNSSFKTNVHVTPTKLIEEFLTTLKKFRISLEQFIKVVFKASGPEDSREFYQFVDKPPMYYDSLKDSELEKFLCIQTWLCKPDNQKLKDFEQS